ncbi:DNA polymerase II large subunit [Halobacteriales archaeon SW_7_65_23]|nr:MAG: DNA polymerase II large subunit [Halobacteriales archaeon SW_7_65_23]
MREEDERYFERLEAGLDEAFAVANAARERGGDPTPEVEIPVARDMADRVENILGIDGVAERVRDLEGEMSREEAALELVSDFVEGSVGDYESRAGKIEGSVRTAVALLTEGVVAAPIEGIDRVELLENDDGTEFINVYYAGPIRSAGGTAQALSVLVADYARALLGIDEYRAREDEVGRYAEEVALYDEETGLQYAPKEKEAQFIAEHMPIMLDGEATGDEEVEGYRDLDRVDTNSARGGMCLVLGEGIALKAPKIQRYTRELDEVDWPWLQDLIDGTYENGGGGADDAETADDGDEAEGSGADGDEDDGDSDGDAADDAGPPRADPSKKFLQDLIAGRPVFSHPSESGGFRLRYGRARNHGHATAGVHPATMRLVDDFLAPGTQIKTERPGKAAGVVPVDTIEGPTVRLANGDVRRIDDAAEALEIRNGVERILDLGEYLVNYGEFIENNHDLAPASYVFEWWVQEFAAAGAPVQAMRDSVDVDLADPTPDGALEWASGNDAPLHPKYTYLWHDVSVDATLELARAIEDGEIATADGATRTGEAASPAGDDQLVLPRTESVCRTLETLLVEHTQGESRVTVPVWRPLVRTLGFDDDLTRAWTAADVSEAARSYADGENAIELVNEVAPFTVRERAPTRIGNRMGRPEKSEERELSPAVHTLFPLGDAGGSQRDVDEATMAGDSVNDEEGKLPDIEVGRRRCVACETETYWPRCPDCGEVAEAVYVCPDCEQEIDPDESGRAECGRCETLVRPTQYTTIDLKRELREAKENVGERASAYDVLKGVKGLSSKEKTPEPLEKGILRAKHDVSAFKDGTVRYDMTDLPVTAVRPAELDVTVEQFRELGYHEDVNGDPLRHDDQLVELKVQDVVLSDGAAEHMLKTADFVDDLLVQYYGLDPYYEFTERDDLVGELVFGMAPHTSAATVGRIVGFTSAAVGYAHPYFHAAKRRNCFHPETDITIIDDGIERSVTVESFVERRLDDPVEDDFGVLVEELDGNDHVRSIGDDGTWTTKPVTAVSKHPAPDHLVRIETEGGRTLTVTPDHRMLRWEDSVETIEAHRLASGDHIPCDGGETDASTSAEIPTAPDGGGPNLDTVSRVQFVPSDVEYTYCLTVAETHRVVANDVAVAQCDGDEDCVMLLLDGLLNFSRTYLPDQRGGSVAEDSRLVAVDPDGDVRFMTFDEFWDELDAPLEVDGKFRKRTCVAEGWQTYAFDEDHEASLQPIEKAIRYRADENERLLRIETQFGRNLTITENHSLFRYDDGIEDVAGGDLSEGDLVLAPRELAVDTQETSIDVTSCFDDPYAVIDDHVEDLLRTAWETTAHGSPTHQAFRSGLAYRLERSKIGYDRFEEILDRAGFETPDDVKIGLERSENGIRKTVELDRDFAWLLGLFVAEGTLSSVCPAIHNSDEQLVEEAVERGERVLGFEPRTRWSNRAYEVRFPAVFREVLYELGFKRTDEYSSSEKLVPECILTAPRELVLEFLRGFIAGDGSESSDDNVTTIGFHTTSEDVKDGIVFLLHRLGLVANVSRRERDERRQPIYTVTVSGGAGRNALREILDGEDSYYPKSLVVSIPEALMEIREMNVPDIKDLIPKYLKRRDNISLEKLREIVTELETRDLPEAAVDPFETLRTLIDGDLSYLRVQTIDEVEYDGYLYDLQVGGEPIFTANWLYAHNSMDAPLVMSSRIDPAEIDDEAHNVDIMDKYLREFYEATRELRDPSDVEDIMTIAEETLGTDREYTEFRHTHDTADIAAGPDLSAYKTLGSMQEKMDAQLSLSRKLRAVDETDVAERIIEFHFLPDLLGNLKAFASQEVRCLGCGEKFRRAPLSGDCRRCGGDVTLTVHEGSVNKYMDTAIRVAEEFGSRPYTKQRLQILEKRIERIFEDDTNKQSGIADFM